MEDLRRKLMEENDVLGLFPAKDRPKTTRPTVSRSSAITISSSSSSSPPTPEAPAPARSNKPARSTAVILSDNEDEENDGAELKRPSGSSKAQQKRLAWQSDDNDDDVVPVEQSKSSAQAMKPLAAFVSNRPDDRVKTSSGVLWETFEAKEEGYLYDPQISAADAEKALKDLVSQSMNEVTEEIDMKLAVVDGFRDDVRLLPHQVIGRTWMKERETGKKFGGILADDMGLGKTIQTLTRIVDGRPRKSDKADGFAASTLVICPVGLVSQWANEINKLAVGLRVIEHHGPGRTKEPEVLKRAHVVITSYSIVSSEHGSYEKVEGGGKSSAKKKADTDDSDSDSSIGKTIKKNKKVTDALFRVKWWRIVLDEAHNIKNRKTKAAIACCALEGKYRWALTGTPIQNNVEELYSLLKFLRIRPLHDWQTFNEQINKPVKSGRSVRAMKRLHVVLKAIMLRRKKDTIINGKPILELPPRIVNVVSCEFDDDEREFYNAIQEKVELTFNKFAMSGDVMRNMTIVLVLLLRLRQACNHPSLISKDFTVDKDAVDPRAVKEGKDLEDDEADELADIFGQMGVSNKRDVKCQMCQIVLTAADTKDPERKHCNECTVIAIKARRRSVAGQNSNLPPSSAKIRKILDLLDEIEERSDGEEKTIIFSQFTSMLDLLQPFLQARGVKFARYDGQMRKDQRELSLEKIRNNSSTKVILISFKAGSTGLNLTSCNNVILVDLWWNPALEEQAFDRAHRFGQTRKVNIFKLTIDNTVEERILALQEQKRALAAAALSGDKMKNMKLGLDDLMALFRHGGHDDEEE